MFDDLNKNALALVDGIVSHGLDGAGPLESAAALASQYREDTTYADDDARIDAMIAWETSKSAVSGFATGVVGGPWAALGIPAGIYSAWVVQARLAGAIAHLRGYSLQDERVRTFVLICLLGDNGVEVLKEVGVKVANRVALNALERLPGRVLIEINKKVGMRLLTKFGTKGIINLWKWIPAVGGVVGAAFDGTTTYSVGQAAKVIFTRRPPIVASRAA